MKRYRGFFVLFLAAGLTAILVAGCSGGGGGGGGSSEGGSSTTAPGVPSNVSATAAKGEVTISWDPVPGAESYVIYFDISPGVDISDAPITVTEAPYTQIALSNGTTYFYTVSAVVSGIEGDLSGEVYATPNFSTTEMQKMLASDAQSSDTFGASVSISGDYAIVGAPGEDGGSGDPISGAGAAYIFHRTGNTWDTGIKITAPDAEQSDVFGHSVSISGDYAIVGADGEDGGPGNPRMAAGAAYIFHRTGTNTWDGGVKVIASDPQAEDFFGTSVSISGDYAIVGAHFEDRGTVVPIEDAGAAYIFHRTGTNTWDSGVKITAPDAQASDFFGYSVSISGDYAIVGATYDDVLSSTTIANAGSAYIFHRIDTNTWDVGTKKVSPEPGAEDRFGWSVSISGDYAVVGAMLEDGGSGNPIGNAGAAYVFHRSGTAWDAGVKIVSPNAQIEGYFGWSVSISGDYTVVGTLYEEGGTGHSLNNSGSAYLFRRTGGNVWDAGMEIFASDIEANDGFGCSVSISGNYINVGSRAEDEGGGGAGAAYIY